MEDICIASRQHGVWNAEYPGLERWSSLLTCVEFCTCVLYGGTNEPITDLKIWIFKLVLYDLFLSFRCVISKHFFTPFINSHLGLKAR